MYASPRHTCTYIPASRIRAYSAKPRTGNYDCRPRLVPQGNYKEAKVVYARKVGKFTVVYLELVAFVRQDGFVLKPTWTHKACLLDTLRETSVGKTRTLGCAYNIIWDTNPIAERDVP